MPVSPSRSIRKVALAAVLSSIVASSAHAAPWEPKTKPARVLMGQGADAFDAADYGLAASLFLKAWEAEPAHLARYNAAQSYAAAGDWKRALDLLNRLLEDKTLVGGKRADVEKRRELVAAFVGAGEAQDGQRWEEARATYVRLLDDDSLGDRDRKHAVAALDELARRRAEAETKAKAPPEPQPQTATPEVDEPDPSATGVSSLPQGRDSGSRPSRFSDTSALIITGAGVAVVALGAGLYLHGGRLEDDATDSDEARRAEMLDRAATERSLGTVALGLGGACVVAGLVKLAIPPSTSDAALVLWPTRSGAIVSIGGRF